MGACDFVVTMTGETMQDAFQKAVNEALRMHGDDSYNGTISTCHCARRIKAYGTYSNGKARQKEVNGIINKRMNEIGKRDCECIDLGVIEYQRISIKKSVKTSNAKFKTMYVLEIDNLTEWTFVKKAEKKADLQDEAKKLVLNGESVRIAKHPVKVSGDDTCETYESVVKKFNTKPKKTKDTVAIKEIHKYVFYGIAAC